MICVAFILNSSHRRDMSRLPYCPNCYGYYLINQDTGEYVRLGCKKYSCPHCGSYKRYQLRKALTEYFQNFEYIRLWTFTFRTGIFYNQRHSWLKVSDIWKRFITSLRRDKRLTKSRRRVQYVKIIEFTRRGYPHYHVLFTEYLPFAVVYDLWNKAINASMNLSGNSGGCNVKGIKSGYNQAHQCAAYVCKYVTKACKDFSYRTFLPVDLDRRRFKLYTRSSKLPLFKKKKSKDNWQFFQIGFETDLEVLNLNILELTSQNSEEKFLRIVEKEQ